MLATVLFTQSYFSVYYILMAHAYTAKGYNKTNVEPRRSIIADGIILSGIVFLLYFLFTVSFQLRSPINQHFSIDLSYTSLFHYALLSTGRMTIAYILSLIFSLCYARIAIHNRHTQSIMIAVLDVLQSIPILSFMPGLVISLVAIFPHSNIGLEIAAVLLIFTSQAWNITFGFYQTLITIPQDLKEVADIAHLGFWQRFTRLEIPAGMISIIWNSMMSWAGGWFFLMASEQFTLGNRSFQLPGLGSYLQEAAQKGNITALFAGLGTLVCIIILLDQLLWRPLVAWGSRFKIELDESDGHPYSWVLHVLKTSEIVRFLTKYILTPCIKGIDTFASNITKSANKVIVRENEEPRRITGIVIAVICSFIFIIGIIVGSQSVLRLHGYEWKMVIEGSFATFGRTLAALCISVLWTVPLGVAIGMNPKLAKKMQPLVQMAASIPATALFPALLLTLLVIPSGLTIAAIVLMLLGTQWYVLFNVIAGAMAIPNDLKEASQIYHITGWKKWKILILPAIFPYLVTGMITATGGAWNASIISEYVSFAGKVHETVGLGGTIAQAANSGNFHLLLVSTITMAFIVFCINRFGWQRIYHMAENRYHID